MDKKLQKIILQKIVNREYCDLERTILDDVQKEVFKDGKTPIPTDAILKHQVQILIDSGKILSLVSEGKFYYTLTAEGQIVFEPWYKKTFHFLLHDRNNLYAILTTLISIAALVISIISLVN
jgi:hypothetical protein